MEFQPGRTTRGPQFSKEDNDTDLYISAAGEDHLDDDAHNPFKQDFSQPIPDADDAALAALAGRYTPPKSTAATGEKRKHPSSPGHTNTPPDLTHSDESSSHEEHETGEGDEEGRPAKRRRRKLSEASKDLLVQPGDDVEEEDHKMRANLERIGSTVEEEDDQPKGGDGLSAEDNHDEGVDLSAENKNAENEEPTMPADETTRPNESDETDVVGVEPAPLMDKLANETSEGEKDAATKVQDDDDDGAERPEDAEDDTDIEPKEGDDYDVENYAQFEDDQDDAAEELEEDGPEMDERLMVNEEELVPAGGRTDGSQAEGEGV